MARLRVREGNEVIKSKRKVVVKSLLTRQKKNDTGRTVKEDSDGDGLGWWRTW